MFYGEAIKIEAFCIKCDFIKTFIAFKFLFVRLFGGYVIPYINYLFLASIFYPSLYVTKPRIEIEKALVFGEEEWSPFESKFWPDNKH